uniref:Uncharacterized protein n=1 Tax=Timema poppense TaxID=170557 RepID=A0A7R9H9V3_TIMPO|nr:unnamed protein product [Timema poppensis]
MEGWMVKSADGHDERMTVDRVTKKILEDSKTSEKYSLIECLQEMATSIQHGWTKSSWNEHYKKEIRTPEYLYKILRSEQPQLLEKTTLVLCTEC